MPRAKISSERARSCYRHAFCTIHAHFLAPSSLRTVHIHILYRPNVIRRAQASRLLHGWSCLLFFAVSLQERELLAEKLDEANERLSQSVDAQARMETSLREMESKHGNVLLLQDEAVKFTLQCLDDQRQIRQSGEDDVDNEMSDD